MSLQKFQQLYQFFFANTTAITSIPSNAPPNLIVKPLPIPEIIPPNKAQSKRSVPAKGEAKLTSIGKYL